MGDSRPNEAAAVTASKMPVPRADSTYREQGQSAASKSPIQSSAGGSPTPVRLSGDEDAHIYEAIEALHKSELAAGALAAMPDGFLAGFYRFLAAQSDCVVLVAADAAGAVVGFATATVSSPGLLGRFVRSNPSFAIRHAAMLLYQPVLLVRTASLATKMIFARPAHTVGVRQLLSIAVACGMARNGLGSRLYEGLYDWFAAAGVRDFDILAATTQTAALAFYARKGARKLAMIRLGGLDTVQFRIDLPQT